VTKITVEISKEHSAVPIPKFIFKLKKKVFIFWITIRVFRKRADAEYVKELIDKPF